MPESRYPKESLLSCMIPLIFLPTYTIQEGKPLHNTHILTSPFIHRSVAVWKLCFAKREPQMAL